MKAFKFNQVPLVYFCFYLCDCGRWVVEELAVISVISLWSHSSYKPIA